MHDNDHDSVVRIFAGVVKRYLLLITQHNFPLQGVQLVCLEVLQDIQLDGKSRLVDQTIVGMKGMTQALLGFVNTDVTNTEILNTLQF